jgi:hypothetical protein
VKRESSIITAPKTENIMALTQHLENRMLRFQKLDEELYKLSKNHLFRYLQGKVCEKCFWETSVQRQAVELLKKYRKEFASTSNLYDKIAIAMLYFPSGIFWVQQTDFAPIQNVVEKIRRLK